MNRRCEPTRYKSGGSRPLSLPHRVVLTDRPKIRSGSEPTAAGRRGIEYLSDFHQPLRRSVARQECVPIFPPTDLSYTAPRPPKARRRTELLWDEYPILEGANGVKVWHA